jgi:hypothetical protein
LAARPDNHLPKPAGTCQNAARPKPLEELSMHSRLHEDIADRLVCSATDSTSGEQTFFVLKQWGGLIDPILPTLIALQTVPGDSEYYIALSTSPDNHHATASTVVLGFQVFDQNTYVFDTDACVPVGFANEQSFTILNKGNTVSPAFNAAQEAAYDQAVAQNAPPSVLQSILNADFTVSGDQEGQFQQTGYPAWTSETAFLLSFVCPIQSEVLNWAGSDAFTMEFDVTGAIIATNAAMIVAPPRAPDPVSIIGGEVARSGSIIYRRQLRGRHGAPIPADRAAGYAPFV